MMSTIDGKIDSGIKGKDILGDYYGIYSKLESELRPDAWMCGRVTSEMFAQAAGTPLPSFSGILRNGDYISESHSGSILVVVDTKGILRWEQNVIVFGDGSIHRLVVLVTDQTPAVYKHYLRTLHISYLESGSVELNFDTALEKVHRIFGVERLVLEGGATLNGSMLETGSVDEISLIMTPGILNRTDAPSVFANTKNDSGRVTGCRLIAMEHVDGGCVWLRYSVGKSI